PGRKQTRCIPPQHQIELVARMLVLQLLESVCRVRQTLATDLDVGDREARVAVNGETAHLQSLIRTRDSASTVRRSPGGNEKHAIQPSAIQGRPSGSEVAAMDGVKSAPEHTHSHG